MVTLRAFATPAEAALAKSLLDDHEIICSLADENSYLYGGAPLAMPVRLMVAEDQLEEAARILKDPPDGGCADFSAEAKSAADTVEPREYEQAQGPNNPWELLVIALLVVIPGIALLLQKGNLVIVASMRRRGITVMPPSDAHLLGMLVIGAAFFLVFLFFYVRRAIVRDQTS
jgi:Putative prokaryotic signal transducing protein